MSALRGLAAGYSGYGFLAAQKIAVLIDEASHSVLIVEAANPVLISEVVGHYFLPRTVTLVNADAVPPGPVTIIV